MLEKLRRKSVWTLATLALLVAACQTQNTGELGRLAFASYREGESAIFTVLEDGTQVSRLTQNSERVSKPDWSPDGTRIAAVLTDAESYSLNIYTMNADGSGQMMLTESDWVDTDPAWSPDGQ